ncbi:dipeptide ABC transporter ATP-binding protein [Pikeienuella piscinae]|uniref:Dipeptide ABC transporter ATP-binding protein n=1 Tax=Pikeienuella piscinae TaxID=2748098 RepID=A0A7L5BV03_9RHOB|nr:dipeptide ABC transporter ATP-binding protein [Pikeienuella piscinae]QIE55532.1 dipeptide ABC transporter ATP-binding protein [Pikeienuella piscinae]
MRTSEPLVVVSGLTKHFRVHGGLLRRKPQVVHAVDDVNFEINAGETLGLVGESGCGKSTVGRLVVRLIEPSAGSVRLNGQELCDLDGRALRARRRQCQFIFQDPYGSLNPRMRVADIIAEPMAIEASLSAAERAERVTELLHLVGLPEHAAQKYPHEFSGGQRQRICIARALSLNPRFIVCDEPVSALDVSVQAQVVNLMRKLQRDLGLSYLFISHDLSVVRHIADRVAVMYLGKLVEIATKRQLYANPSHPYTRALLAAVPEPDPQSRTQPVELAGDIPSPIDPPKGCRFHTRCPLAFDRCRVEEPVLRETTDGHAAACHLSSP